MAVISADRVVWAASPSRMAVTVSYGRHDRRTLDLVYPDPTYSRVSVIGYRTDRGPAELTEIVGTPSGGPGQRPPLIPPLPERFVPLAYVLVPASISCIIDALISTEPDPTWRGNPNTIRRPR